MRRRGIELLIAAVAGLCAWLGIVAIDQFRADRITAVTCARIRPGMTEDRVRGLLGTPAWGWTGTDGSKGCAWKGSQGEIRVYFGTDGTVSKAVFLTH